MIRVESSGHVFELEEPRGSKGLALHRLCSGVIGACKFTPPMVGMSRAEAASAMHGFMMRLVAHPQGQAVLAATLGLGTMDDAPFELALLEAMPITECMAPWEALIEVWTRLGFFGAGMREALLAADQLRQAANQEETPTSE